jgi:calcineurin-like phosphoesterase family protein
MLLSSNAADLNFNPLPYFPEFLEIAPCIRHNYDRIEWGLIEPKDRVILSGDIINFDNDHKEHRDITALGNITGGRLILWSGGISNSSNIAEEIVTNLINKFELISTREFGFQGIRYVPCVSSMMKELDFPDFQAPQKFGVIEHKNFPIKDFSDIPKISNAYALPQILSFIRRSDTIITNSYHIIYWATLLKRKVIVCFPYADKYRFLKYPPARYSGDLELDSSKAGIYPDTLSESRRLNELFFNDCLNLIKSDNGENRGMQKILSSIFKELQGKRVAIRGNGKHTEYLLKFDLFTPVLIWDKSNETEIDDKEIDVVVISSYDYRAKMREEITKKGYAFFDMYDKFYELGINVNCNFWEADVIWE